jgi:lysophospholipase L1-like esterase
MLSTLKTSIMHNKASNIFRQIKSFFIPIFLMLVYCNVASAQNAIPHYPDSLFSTYYHQRATQFRLLPYTQNSIIFLGNSITAGGNWSEMFQDPHVLNRGISGDVTKGVLNRLDEIVSKKPHKIFLMIGTNDLARGVPPDTIIKNILWIVSLVHQYSPATKMYVQSIFPVNPARHVFPSHVNKSADINYINKQLQANVQSSNYTYINVHDALTDKEGHLDLHYTNDGLHLLGPGYMVWKHVVYPYIYGLQQKPSLVPKPQKLQWGYVKFPLYKCKMIVAADTSFMNNSGCGVGLIDSGSAGLL